MQRPERSVSLRELVDHLLERVLLWREPDDVPAAAYSGITFGDGVARPGDLHVNLHGPRQAAAAVHRALDEGAVASLWRNPSARPPAPGVVFDVIDERRALSAAAALLHQHPSRRLRTTGVTGTSGKSTTAATLYWILRRSGVPTGLVSSIAQSIGTTVRQPGLTTPDAPDMQRLLAEMVDSGLEAAVIEASSEGLRDGRVADVDFDIGICTTFGLDHLDVHPTTGQYLRAKQVLFRALGADGLAVFNADVAEVGTIVARSPAARIGVGFSPDADAVLTGSLLCVGAAAGDIIGCDPATIDVATRFPGAHSRMNSAMAAVSALRHGVEPRAIESALASFPGVPRRLQLVYAGRYTLVDDRPNPHSMETTVVPVLRPLRDRSTRFVACWAPRGSRGADLNRAQATVYADTLDRLAVDIVHLSRSADVVGDADALSDEELGVVIEELRDAAISPQVHHTLDAAITAVVDDLRDGDLIVLLGAQGMDDGARLFADRVASHERLSATASEFGTIWTRQGWREV